MNWHSFFFLLFALVACGFALAVVFTSNIVRMAFYLTLSLGATSGLFFLAGADFVGAMQLLIYVGGTLVLLIFGVMLTAQGPFISMKTDGGEWVLAAIVGGSLLGGACCRRRFSVREWRELPDRPRSRDRQDEPTATPIGHGAARACASTADEVARREASRDWPATCCRSKSSRCICWSC